MPHFTLKRFIKFTKFTKRIVYRIFCWARIHQLDNSWPNGILSAYSYCKICGHSFVGIYNMKTHKTEWKNLGV